MSSESCTGKIDVFVQDSVSYQGRDRHFRRIGHKVSPCVISFFFSSPVPSFLGSFDKVHLSHGKIDFILHCSSLCCRCICTYIQLYIGVFFLAVTTAEIYFKASQKFMIYYQTKQKKHRNECTMGCQFHSNSAASRVICFHFPVLF